MGVEVLFYIIIFAFGVCTGSFLNVCIIRIPEKKSIVPSSQCASCGMKLKWYELVPIFSYIALRGKCRGCKNKISLQYPLIEGINGIMWVIVFVNSQLSIPNFQLAPLLIAFICCLTASVLLVIAVIDYRTLEIPPSLNVAILILGVLNLLLDLPNWHIYLIGAVSVSGVLLVLWFITSGRAMGGGDIKLMAVCGLLLGWKLIIIAFLLGCVIGTIIHAARMIIVKADRVLAFGPYLAAGVFISMLWGGQILNWYLSFYN